MASQKTIKYLFAVVTANGGDAQRTIAALLRRNEERDMKLNLPVKSDDFLTYAKFNAKTGRWHTKDDAGTEIEIKDMTAIVDLAKIKIGWIRFTRDAAPDAVWDVDGVEAPQPSREHKRGFSVRLYSVKNLGGLRELMSNSSAVNAAIVELYSAFEAAPEHRQGQVPVVHCQSVLPIASRHGQNFRPVLRIINWVERPEGMNGAAVSPHAQPQPPSAPQPSAPWAMPMRPETSPAVFDDDIPDF